MSTSMASSFALAAARAQATSTSASLRVRYSRCFSTSPRHYVRAVFGEASNDTLRSTLNEIQEKITLPAHLPKAQRSILKDPRRKNYVEQNPVVIEIEGLEHKYTTLLLPKNQPHSKKIFKTAIHNMTTQEDWANLETLLAGFKKAGIVLKPRHFGLATRWAIHHDQVYTLIDCARHANDTGYLLKTEESGLLLLKAIADRATTEHHGQAIKWLEQVQDILERPPHDSLSGIRDLRQSKIARGLMLSARVADIQATETPSQAQLDLLKDEVERLRSIWIRDLEKANGSLILEVDECNLNVIDLGKSESSDAKMLITAGKIPVYHMTSIIAHNIKGLEGALTILGEDSDPFPSVSKQLDAYLTEMLSFGAQKDAHVQRRMGRFASAYREILGRAPTWAEPEGETEKGKES